jgi:hypothetical protein
MSVFGRDFTAELFLFHGTKQDDRNRGRRAARARVASGFGLYGRFCVARKPLLCSENTLGPSSIRIGE